VNAKRLASQVDAMSGDWPCIFWVLCDWSRPCWCIVEGGLKYFNDLNYNARHCFSKLLLQGHFRSSLSWVPSGHPFIILRSLE
jgi:hypothetical protein